MPRNIEIKARIGSIEALEPRIAGEADGGPLLIQQDDRFFNVSHGRLKLRAFADGTAELIAYERADQAGPKLSSYAITPVLDVDAVCDELTRGFGLRGRVRKLRRLYLIGSTRVHLDRVEGLGDFLELEVVLADEQGPDEGMAVAQALMQRWGIADDALVPVAYIDLLEGRAARD